MAIIVVLVCEYYIPRLHVPYSGFPFADLFLCELYSLAMVCVSTHYYVDSRWFILSSLSLQLVCCDFASLLWLFADFCVGSATLVLYWMLSIAVVHSPPFIRSSRPQVTRAFLRGGCLFPKFTVGVLRGYQLVGGNFDRLYDHWWRYCVGEATRPCPYRSSRLCFLSAVSCLQTKDAILAIGVSG